MSGTPQIGAIAPGGYSQGRSIFVLFAQDDKRVPPGLESFFGKNRGPPVAPPQKTGYFWAKRGNGALVTI